MSCEIGATPRLRFLKEAGRFKCAHDDHGAQLALKIFEQDAARALNGAFADDGSAQFEVGGVETDLGAIGELYGGGSTQPTRETVLAHLANELVVTM